MTIEKKPATEQSWPLIGRDQELAAIISAYRRMRESAGGGGVVLLGAAGVGKTRLAREAVTRLAAEGCPTAWATATRSAAAVPLGALAHLLISGNRDAVDRSAGGQLDALASLVARFAGHTGPAPLVAVDDVHLLDDASAALVHHLATNGDAFVLLTARAGEPAPDAATAVWADDVGGRIDVAPLREADVVRVLRHALGGPLDPISGRELRHICAGNPMLLRELLHAGRSSGALYQVDGVWRWASDKYVTSRLVDVVQARLGTLEPQLRAVVEPLACGEPLPVPMLEALAGHEALALAEQRRLLAIENSGGRLLARLAHPLYADVVRASLPPYRERQIQRSLAEAIEATPMRRRDDVLYAAQWRLRAGMTTRPELMLVAVERARHRADLRLAEELAQAARRAGAGWRGDLALAEVLVAKGQYAEAAAALPPFGALPTPPPAAPGPSPAPATPPPSTVPGLTHPTDHDLRVRWQVADNRIRYWGRDRDAALRAGGDDPPDMADPTAEAARSWLLLLDGQCAEALRVATGALQSPHLGPDAANWAAAALTASAGLQGRHEYAMEAMGHGLAVAEGNRESHAWGTAQVGAAGCLALLASGRLTQAAELAGRGYRDAVEMAAVLGTQASPMVGLWAAVRGIVARNQGRVPTAMAALRDATALLADWPTFQLSRVYLAELAAAHALAGDLAAAGEWLDRADLTGSPGRLFDAWVERDRGWVAAARGDLAGAAAQARHAAGLAQATGQPTVEAFALYDAARFGEADKVHERLEHLAGSVGGELVPALASAVAALGTSGAADALDRTAAVLADAGQLLYAAETAITAHHRHARSGRRLHAEMALRRATELVGACPKARTHLLDLTGTESTLTPRELHVAMLAAAGQSSPAIAAQLGLSVRTVNNHLGRTYAKLGVSGRGQLAQMLNAASTVRTWVASTD